jgi:NitT/TauT family transport system substrate-binding protein
MNLHRLLAGVTVAALLLLPAGLSAQQPATLRIAFNGFGGIAPLYVAQDAGIFKKRGISLEMIFIPGGSLSLQALIGNSLDLLLTGGPPVVNAYLRGARIKIIAGVTNLLPYMFLASGAIKSAEQLKGKSIGIARFGSNTDYVVRLALTRFGMSPNEVNIVQVGGSQARLTAMTSGAIHATVLSPEQAFVAQKLGFNVLLDFIEKGIEFPHVNFVAREDYLATQAHIVKPLMAAYLEAVRYYKSHKEEGVKKVMALNGLDRATAEKVYAGNLPALPDDGRPTLKGLEVVLEATAKEDPKAKSLTVQQLLDLRFLP